MATTVVTAPHWQNQDRKLPAATQNAHMLYIMLYIMLYSRLPTHMQQLQARSTSPHVDGVALLVTGQACQHHSS
jgi:hypothetical protein